MNLTIVALVDSTQTAQYARLLEAAAGAVHVLGDIDSSDVIEVETISLSQSVNATAPNMTESACTMCFYNPYIPIQRATQSLARMASLHC